MSGYRPELEEALRMLAEISAAMAERRLPRPILVGSAAVEFYTLSAINTGDFDLCSPRQSELEEEMQKRGFVRPLGQGKSTEDGYIPRLGWGSKSLDRLFWMDIQTRISSFLSSTWARASR